MISKKPDLEGIAFELSQGLSNKNSGFYHSWNMNLQFITDKLL